MPCLENKVDFNIGNSLPREGRRKRSRRRRERRRERGEEKEDRRKINASWHKHFIS